MSVSLDVVVAFVCGACLGAWVAAFVVGTRARAAAALAEAAADRRHQESHAEVRERAARLEVTLAKEREAADERLAAARAAETRLTETFEALSAQALDRSTDRLLELASARFGALRAEASGDLSARQAEVAGLVDPIRDALRQVAQTIAEVEQARNEDKGSLLQRLEGVSAAQLGLQTETARLVRALQAPHVRGRWGEVQLRRVVELAGLEAHCDFVTQQTVWGGDGAWRPDLVVTLPGGRTVVVDAKAPVTAYLDALNAPDDTARDAGLRDHAAQVRAHVAALGAKAYWARFETTPDFVVLFLPGESFFSAAVQHDPGLFEYGVSQRVFLAGPFTLLALLRTVAHGWRSERLADNARLISEQARELYERLVNMAEHFVELRKRLAGAVDAHNQAVGSLESRVLPAARRMKDLGVLASKDLPAMGPVEQTPRRIQATDLVPAIDAVDVSERSGVPFDALETRADD